MVRTRKIEEGDKAPTLYSFQNDQYDFNDLSKRVDSGLNGYLSVLKDGDKYEREFRRAVSDIMSGIKNGTVTYDNGRFIDSLGRYTNNEDESKDIYGWAANYIYNQMNMSKKYQPDAKELWDPSKSLLNDVFGTTKPNVDNFIDIDPYNSETKTRGTSGRAKIITDWINKSLDNSAIENSDWKERATAVRDRLADGNIDAGDLYYLDRAFPGISWRDLFRTTEVQQNDKQNIQEQGSQQLTPEGFYDYVQQVFPRTDGDTVTIDFNFNDNLGQYTNKRYIDYIESLSDDQLYSYLGYISENPNTDFGQFQEFRQAAGGNGVPVSASWVGRQILETLRRRGKLIDNGQGVETIPEMIDNNTNSGFYYDYNTKKLYKKNLQDIPYWQDQLWSQYFGEYTIPDWITNRFSASKYKKGGIIKGEKGRSLNIYFNNTLPEYSQIGNLHQDESVLNWYNNFPTIQEYENAVRRNVDERSLYKINQFDNSQRVDYNSGIETFNRNYQNNGNTLNAYFFGNSLSQYTNNQGLAQRTFNINHNSIAQKYGDKFNSDPTKAYIDGFLGAQTYLRTMSLTDPNIVDNYNLTSNIPFGHPDYNPFGDWGSYWKGRGAVGAYYYKANGDNIGQWIPTTDKKHEGIILFGEPLVPTQPGNPDSPVGDPIPDSTPDLKKKDSVLFPVTGDYKSSNEFNGNRLQDILEQVAPDLIGAGRLFTSLRTNNRVARALNESLRPVLKNTYEKYSPITGAFGEMQLRSGQAANLRRQASRPFTSDASLQLAGQLEADRQARDLEYQGFLADDREIRRTREAALNRQEDNMARRSDIANFNRASINQTNREKARLEATRLRHNWQSVDNFMQGIEGRLRTNLTERRTLRQNASMQAARTRYQEFLQRFNEDYKRDHPNATQETMLNDPYYIQKVQDLRRRYQYDTYNIGLGRYYRDPYAGIYDKDNIPTYESVLYSKNGGRLRPSIMTMINKVVKNESYT